MIQLAAGVNYVAYQWGAPEMTLADALAPIWDYFMGSYRWNREAGNWSSGSPTTVMHPGEHWAINVSQACTLENFRWWTMHINEVAVAGSAVAGAAVPVEVLIYNYRPEAIPFVCTVDGNGIGIELPYDDCPGEGTTSLSGHFTMPNKDVTLHVWGWYWDGSGWVLDDWKDVTVQVVSLPPDVLEFTCPVEVEQYATFPLSIWYAWCGPIYLKIRSNFTVPKYMLFKILAVAEYDGAELGSYITGHFKVCAEGFTGCLPGEGIATVLPGEEVVKNQWDYAPTVPDPDLRLSVISEEPTHLCLQLFASDEFAGPYEWVAERFWKIEKPEVTYAFSVGSPGVSAA